MVQKLYTSRAVLIIGGAFFLLLIGILLSSLSAIKKELAASTQRIDELQHEIAESKRAYCDAGHVQQQRLETFTRTSGGIERTYRVHTPDGYDTTRRYPVIMAFDGLGGSASHIEAYSHIDSLPVISVYPEATKTASGVSAWQGAPYSRSGVDDIGFVRDILEDLPKSYCVDTTQLFAVGMSNGGGFAAFAGCYLGDVFKAVATVSGAYYAPCPRESKLSSILAIHSVDDHQVPFKGVSTRWRKLPAVRSWAGKQAAIRDCSVAPVRYIGDAVRYSWTCENNTAMELVVVRGQGHGWLHIPEQSEELPFNMARYIWRFFESH
jgi:polyhydroxybutyrate depolymerase